MSSALAIAGVSAVLKNLLNTALIEEHATDALGVDVKVSSMAPDAVPLDGSGAGARLNLFLYQVTANAAWRNVDLPSRDASGRKIANAPLGLDLHYLLTAYGVNDLHAEVLLGCGVQLLHEKPVLGRETIRAVLRPTSGPAPLPLRAGDLAEQVELLKITLSAMSAEEMSRLWSALQAHYRPTAAFQVSVVLIESQQPAVAPLPVLTRGRFDTALKRDEGVTVLPDLVPPYPALESLGVAAHATPGTVQLGDAVIVRGHHLAGTKRAIVLHNDRFGVDQTITLPDESEDSDSGTIAFTVPELPAALPVGLYSMELRLQRPGDMAVRSSNALPVALAPSVVTSTPMSRSTGDLVRIHVQCKPHVRVGQRASLVIDTREVTAKAFGKTTATLDFELEPAPPSGTEVLLRLKVDGIESIIVNRAVQPPRFFDFCHVTLP